MTERKPMGMTFDSWIDRQIDQSIKRGEFDHLPGKGKPLSGVDEPYDPDWWLKEKLKHENLDITPDTLVARRTVERWLESYLDTPTLPAVQRQIEKLNETIQVANTTDLGPLLPQPLLDVERLSSEWLRNREIR